MKMNPLSADTAELLALAEDIAALLEEKREELGLTTDFEALLRARIAAAAFAINSYLALLADRKLPEAQRHLPEAKRRCDRSIQQLRRRVSRTILQLRRHLNEQELNGVVRTTWREIDKHFSRHQRNTHGHDRAYRKRALGRRLVALL